MPGFEIAIGKYDFEKRSGSDKIICRSAEVVEGSNAHLFTLNKFLDDKLFEGNDEVFIILDGVILNKKILMKGKSSWFNTVHELYKSEGETFINSFRGSFCGAIYDKIKGQWFIFTDHIGSKYLYYSHASDGLYISSEIVSLYQILSQGPNGCSLDENSAYTLLTYGYMLGEQTLSKEIKKVLPGHYIKYDGAELTDHQYYQLPLSTVEGDIDEADIINEIDLRFRQAVKFQFEKDREYGYKHLVGLSGGLDSRMTSWVAHDLGYTEQLNFTFSQSDYLDETIPKKIAADLRHEWIFKALDNGTFLKDIEEINQISGGNVLYYGLAHGNSLFKLLNFDEHGILHSGQLGDIVIGSFIKSLNERPEKTAGVYSSKLLDRLRLNFKSPSTLEAKERFLIYQRGFNGANNGLLASQNYSETLSPFYDIDFFEYCLTIPIKHRKGHNLYKKWIIQKYPEASKYIWEATKAKITSRSYNLKLRGTTIPIRKLLPVVLTKMGVSKPVSSTRNHMNPLDYWYHTNESIREFQDKYFAEHINNLNQWPNLKADVESLYNQGGARDKNQALTLVSAIKMFFKPS